MSFGLAFGLALSQAGGGSSPPSGTGDYALIEERFPAGTGTNVVTVNVWNKRQLNTIVQDPGTIVTAFSSNQFTLAAGTYSIFASAFTVFAGANKIRLRNITAGITAVLGTNSMSSNGYYCNDQSLMWGKFVIASSSVFEIQHYPTIVTVADMFGQPVGAPHGEVEVYCQVRIQKES